MGKTNTMARHSLKKKIQLWEGKLYISLKSGYTGDADNANKMLNSLYQKEDRILHPEEYLHKSD